MQYDRDAHERGAAEARQDLAVDQLRWFSGAPSRGWGIDLAETLRSCFGVEVRFTSCLVTDEQLSFWAGYNATIEAHIDSVWGARALADALAAVEQRRQQRYDAWVAANKPI
jgi:hypothetical protein